MSRTQARNRAKFFFSTFASKTPHTDADGFLDGEFTIDYNGVNVAYGNISPARGQAQLEQFGVDTKYSKTICLPGTQWQIDETTRIWIGVDAYHYDATKTYAVGDKCINGNDVYQCTAAATGTFDPTKWKAFRHNYSVVTVAVSLGTTSIAIIETK